MIKKKKFFNEQKILTFYSSKITLISIIKKSFSKNFELPYAVRILNSYQKPKKWYCLFKTRTKLRCFYSFRKGVPAKSLQLSRHIIATDTLAYYLSNYTK